jgi:DNA-binding FadR family transcriptional regulator
MPDITRLTITLRASLPERLRAVAEPSVIQAPKVLSAREQVARHLRELIVSGDLPLGARLPSEEQLADTFGVSRATVREALRTLSAENLIQTTRGQSGGSRVAAPSLGNLAATLESNIRLLVAADGVSLPELLEARQTLEVPATSLAAARRDDQDLARIRASLVANHKALPTSDQFDRHREFHAAVLEACGNRLLSLSAQPIFVVLQTRLAGRREDPAFQGSINQQHHAIVEAIEQQDTERAAVEMAQHLDFLRPHYERIW